MALKQCRECGAEVSLDTTTCPQCGTASPAWAISQNWTPPSPPSIELKHIVSYMEENGLYILAEQTKNGSFVPNFEKWERHIREIRERRLSYAKRVKESDSKERSKGNRPRPKEVPAQPKEVPAQPQEKNKQLINKVKTQLQSQDGQRRTSCLNIHRHELQQFLNYKWQEITSINRRFGLDQNKDYNTPVFVPILNQLGIESIRFFQKQFRAPSIGLYFIMNFGVEFECSLDQTGKLSLHPGLGSLFPYEYHRLLNLSAVVYYADLVISQSRDMSSFSRITSTEIGTQTPNKTPSLKRIKRMPRVYRRASFNDQSRIHQQGMSLVDPFRRRLPKGQKPNFTKIIEADQFGINLQGPGYPEIQYTFVRAHNRGSGGDIPQYSYSQDYQAAKTFETILDVIGFS